MIGVSDMFSKEVSEKIIKLAGLDSTYALSAIHDRLVHLNSTPSIVKSILEKESLLFLEDAISAELNDVSRCVEPPPHHCFVTLTSSKGKPVLVTLKTIEVEGIINI